MTRWPLDPVLPHQFKLGCVCGSSGKMPLCARCALIVSGISVGIAAAKLVHDTLIAVDTPSARSSRRSMVGAQHSRERVGQALWLHSELSRVQLSRRRGSLYSESASTAGELQGVATAGSLSA